MSKQSSELSNSREQMVRALERLRGLLEAHASQMPAADETFAPDPRSALARLCDLFRLSDFERDVLTLAASAEFDGTFPELCGRAAGDPSRSFATLSLALAAFPNPAWSALLPSSPLRYWRLIQIEGSSLVGGAMSVDEPILHALLGFSYYDARLRSLMREISTEPAKLSSAQEAIAGALADVWQREQRAKAQLVCSDMVLARSIAARTAMLLGLQPVYMDLAAFPASPAELSETVRLCERLMLMRSGLAIFECADGDESQRESRENTVSAIAQRFGFAAMFTTPAKLDVTKTGTLSFDVLRPTREEQAAHWSAHLRIPDDGRVARRLSAQFDLHLDTIDAAIAAASPDAAEADVWEIVRRQARPRLDVLMERLTTDASWSDLVLPGDRRRLMRQIVAHVQYRDVVFGEWGFSETRNTRGMTVLFVGPSGTGKSLAARVIANALRLDLYRVDLSAVFSKYIGETEKNLRQIFDAAESGGVVLVFDEADALFGKRSEVKDSHDRHANVEVSYLLQRLERFNGVAILTSNLREAFDAAFMRRFAFVVEFPFPDANMRKRIWKRAFPRSVPTEELNFDLLGRLAVPGGNIANIALNAAVRAASHSGRVGMNDVAAAVRLEYAKLDRSLHDPDLTRWLEAVPQNGVMEHAL